MFEGTQDEKPLSAVESLLNKGAAVTLPPKDAKLDQGSTGTLEGVERDDRKSTAFEDLNTCPVKEKIECVAKANPNNIV